MAVTVISTVVVAAASATLCTVDDVKEELGITGTAQDAYLGKLVTRCSAAVLQYLGQPEMPETVRDMILPDPEPQPTIAPGNISGLALSRRPVSAVLSVSEGGTPLVADQDFVLDSASGLLVRLDQVGMPRTWAAAAIVAVFKSGADPLPADITDATIRLVKARWFARGRDPMLRSENIPGVREASYWVAAGGEDGNMPPDVADILDGYRQPVIA